MLSAEKLTVLATLLVTAAGCNAKPNATPTDSAAAVSVPAAAPASAAASSPVVYVANLLPLNSKANGGDAIGEARLTINSDSLTITTNVRGVTASMMHLQHFHGFPDNRDAVCPTASADVNHDGVIDLRETEPTSGTTMVPFTDDPVSMKIEANTYPTADAKGSFNYTKTVSLAALNSAFTKTFNDSLLDIGHRVVMVHGVPAATKFPKTVASLGTIPAQVTVPVACGKLVRAAQ